MSIFSRMVAGLLIFTLFIPKGSVAQSEPDFDEIPVFLNVKALGSIEIPAIIKNEVLFLSITGLFNFLKITYLLSPGSDSLSGFFLNPQDPYMINMSQHRIIYQKKIFDFKSDDFIRSEDQLFLKSKCFGEVFGLECVFDIRSLSVILTSASELPVIKAMRMEKLRLNFNPSDIAFSADTIIGSRFRLLHFGAADWTISATQKPNGLSYARFGLSLGGMLAGGELKSEFTHVTNRPFLEKQQYYLWRYANNNSKAIRQISAGKISIQSISSIFDPVVGVQVTNAPTYYRKSFGTYIYRGYAQPDCLAEIYVNNTLIDYIRADASGFITYNIPLAYGNTEVKLRYYGSLGDEYTDEKNFVIPLTFLPENEFEYTLSTGIVEDQEGSFFSQARINYGLSDKITIGGGLEYLSSNESVQNLPFLNASVRVAPNMLFSGEYVSGIRYKGKLTYQSPYGLQFELDYVRYNDLQEAIKYNYIEQRKAVISMPFHFRTNTLVSRLAFNQNFLGARIFNELEMQLSLAGRGINVNITNSAVFRLETVPTIYSTITSSITLPAGIRFGPRVIYKYTDKKFISINLGIEKSFSGYLSVNASYEQRFDHPVRNYRVGFKYNFSFARISSTISISKNATNFYQSASGSMIYEKKLGHVNFMKNSNVGRGGVIFEAFLDLNGNEKMDIDEQKVKGLHVKMHSGGGVKTSTDSTIIITALEPYIYYAFTADGNGFENISWKINKPALSIVIEPNQLKVILIPIVSVGEVSGMVYNNVEKAMIGIGRIRVNIYDDAAVQVATILTESDGYFSYLGLIPGNYIARIDESQLHKAHMSADPASLSFTIRENREGDIVDDLQYVIKESSEK